jgi:hypothetical protein
LQLRVDVPELLQRHKDYQDKTEVVRGLGHYESGARGGEAEGAGLP